MNALLSVLLLLVASAGCGGSAKPDWHGNALEIDGRYVQVIELTALDIQIPLDRNGYIRVDAPVTNTLAHLHTVLRELGVTEKRAFFSNPAQQGMQVHLRFRDGKQCSFIWVRQDADPRLVKASLDHEKYHAVCRLKPEAIDAVAARISGLGFKVNLTGYDEEFAATVVEVLALHRQGIPLEEIHGSEAVEKAVAVLKASMIVPTKGSPANGDQPVRQDTNRTSSANVSGLRAENFFICMLM
jgi:hypothetical protein